MRIVMIGHSNVGKTTYMASMYGAMQVGVNGFTLRAARTDDHERFLALHRMTRAGRYPALTDQRAQYDFRLCHNGEAFFDFTWVDRRGGAILERSGSTETDQLIRDLKECDGLLVFCDAAAAERGDEDANEMERISQLVGRAVADRARNMPVCVVFTKSDLINGDEGTIERVLNPVRSLCSTVAASRTMIGSIIAVACGPDEQNVVFPVLFALYYGIVYRGNGLAAEVERQASLAQEYAARANEWLGLGELWRIMQGETTYTTRANDAQEEARRQYAALEPLIEPAQALEPLIEQLNRF
jgi:GTPase SAR1 family protein